MQIPKLSFCRHCIYLTHVSAFVLLLNIRNVKKPSLEFIMLVMCHGYSWVSGNYVIMYSQYCWLLKVHPSDLSKSRKIHHHWTFFAWGEDFKAHFLFGKIKLQGMVSNIFFSRLKIIFLRFNLNFFSIKCFCNKFSFFLFFCLLVYIAKYLHNIKNLSSVSSGMEWSECSHNKTYSWECCSLKYVIYLDLWIKMWGEKIERKIRNYINRKSIYVSISILFSYKESGA